MQALFKCYESNQFPSIKSVSHKINSLIQNYQEANLEIHLIYFSGEKEQGNPPKWTI